MNFKRINNLTGWIVCLIACTVYILTSEAGGSLWDCGEFVSSAFKLQIPHPPGAPLFVLIGRFFIILFGDNPATAAKAVNIMSALASGFTILFLFWTITHFARRIVQKTAVELTSMQIWSVMGAGVVGALAYTFSDSFWYSAVEGEVYALSSFFTAIVFWAILKWEHEADEPGADRWIVFIFFMMGLSIGVHLLNLLTIPAIVMVYYFRRGNTFNYPLIRKWFVRLTLIGGALAFVAALLAANGEANPERNVPMDATMAGLVIFAVGAGIGLLYLVESFNKQRKAYIGGAYIFFIIGCVVTGIVQVAVIQFSIKGAGAFDVFFKNSLGLPFFTGFIFFFVLLAVLIWLGLRYATKRNWPYLRLALWSLAFILIGYSTYLTTMIRSNADPAVDMYNVDNPMSLVGYLGREQYGDFPIIYGQKFTAQPVDFKYTSTKYEKGKDKYIESGKDGHYVYMPDDKMVFPRVWDASNDQGHADYYSFFLGIQKQQDGTYERAPTFGESIKFFVSYQNYWMYLRYFLWNFSGKQNDVQGLFSGNVRDGNWITGIGFMDNALYGDQSYMPDSLQHNKANNKLFLLPFILGLIGMFYQFKRKGDDGFITFLLFFFTGFAVVIYLNQAGYQPRERDYAYVGSFYAFAIWIGLAVLYFIDLAANWDRKLMNGVVTGGAVIAAVALLAGLAAGRGLGFGLGFGILFGLIAAGVPYILKYLKNYKSIVLVAVALSLCVPLLMGQQEWDDHDRSRKQMARDLAKDYLESCAPNAILFTFGDNDTYPLWYAQEVEGIRPDIRVINTSLLGIDWYINQLRYKVNKSDPIDVIWGPEKTEGRNRDYVLYTPKPQFPETKYYDLYDMMKNYVGSDDPSTMVDRGGGDMFNTFPVRKVSVPVDKNLVLQNGTVNAKDSVVSEMQFEIPANKSGLLKNDLAMLNIIAASHWKRPIYFTGNYDELGFGKYVRRDGLTFRLVPVEGQNQVNTDWALNKMMNVFSFGNANLHNVYFDEENRRHLNTIRIAYTELALDLASKNRKEEARNALTKVDKMMLDENFAYGMASRANQHNRNSLMFLQACYAADAKDLAVKVSRSVKKDLEQQLRFYDHLEGSMRESMEEERRVAESYLNGLKQLDQMNQAKGAGPEAGKAIKTDSSK
ncbi:MAG: rane protein [Chitinophagaceae bacterium]|nr:rane protein [Chitinophagaceae bacterium]